MPSLLWVLVAILVIFAIIGAPGVGMWQHSWGYGPSGISGVVILVLVILLLTGRL